MADAGDPLSHDDDLSDSDQQLIELPTPPTDVEYAGTKAELIERLQAWVEPYGYAISTKRSKPYASGPCIGDIHKVDIQCDRGSKQIPSKAIKRKRTGSRSTKCPFRMLATHRNGLWTLQIREAGHNHEPSDDPEAHPKQRMMQMTQKLKEKLKHESNAGSTPNTFLTAERLAGKL